MWLLVVWFFAMRLALPCSVAARCSVLCNALGAALEVLAYSCCVLQPASCCELSVFVLSFPVMRSAARTGRAAHWVGSKLDAVVSTQSKEIAMNKIIR